MQSNVDASGAAWFIVDGTRSLGPVSTLWIVDALRVGAITPLAHVWRVGGQGWVPLSALPEFADVVHAVGRGEAQEGRHVASAPGAPKGASTATVVAWVGAFLLVFAVVLVVAGESIPSTPTSKPNAGVGGASAGSCSELRACCDRLETVLPPDPANPHRRDDCVDWTVAGTDSRHQGQCAYGTECWCGRMLSVFRTKYGFCK